MDEHGKDWVGCSVAKQLEWKKQLLLKINVKLYLPKIESQQLTSQQVNNKNKSQQVNKIVNRNKNNNNNTNKY